MIHLRTPTGADGADLWSLARDSRALDLNSPYAYLMMAHWFSDTCVVADSAPASPADQPTPQGFVLGFVPPKQPDTLFVWQVAVADSARGQGLASRMIMHLLAQNGPTVRFVEATVTPSNAPSNALFSGLAQKHGVPCTRQDLFAADDFPHAAEPLPNAEQGIPPAAQHEGEVLYRIGPFVHP